VSEGVEVGNGASSTCTCLLLKREEKCARRFEFSFKGIHGWATAQHYIIIAK
jgi:hypothetical protein